MCLYKATWQKICIYFATLLGISIKSNLRYALCSRGTFIFLGKKDQREKTFKQMSYREFLKSVRKIGVRNVDTKQCCFHCVSLKQMFCMPMIVGYFICICRTSGVVGINIPGRSRGSSRMCELLITHGNVLPL